MALRAKIYKSGFEAGFHTGDFPFVYIGFFLDSGSVFNIQIVEALSIDEGNSKFLFLRSVDQHAFHWIYIPFL